MISANHAATSASDAGDHGDGGTSPELLGTVLQMVVCDGVGLYGELEEWRIHWWRRMELGWPEATATTTTAAAGVRGDHGFDAAESKRASFCARHALRETTNAQGSLG